MDPAQLTPRGAEHLARGAAAAQALAAAGLPAPFPSDLAVEPKARTQQLAAWAAGLEEDAASEGLLVHRPDSPEPARAKPTLPAEIKEQLSSLQTELAERRTIESEQQRTIDELQATVAQRDQDLAKLRHLLAAYTRVFLDDRDTPATAQASPVSAADTVTAILSEHGPLRRAGIVERARIEHGGQHRIPTIDQALHRMRKSGDVTYQDGIYDLAPNNVVELRQSN